MYTSSKCGMAPKLDLPPPAGFNVETIEYKNLRLTVWDVGGQHQASGGTTLAVCGQFAMLGW